MKTLHPTIRSTREGSALLIAVLVMGILITLTLGLSDLVIREIRQTSDVVGAGKAYFAAEAGVENALMDLHQNLPGFETKNPSDPSDKFIKIQDPATGLDARYQILNKADKVPYFDPEKPIFLGPNQGPTNVDFVYTDHAEVTFNEIPLSESVVIPLYSAKDDGSAERVDNFLIEYYVNYQDINLNLAGLNNADVKNLDILRWKIFGKPDPALGGNPAKTEAISDFFPSAYNASANTPMCIGTDDTLAPNGADQGCLKPVLAVNASSDDGGATFWGAARECYGSDSGASGGALADIQKVCTIQNFVKTHIQNYLVLTNVINPDVLMPGMNLNTAEAKQRLKIFYRVVARPGQSEPKLVREAAAISADGFAGDGKVKQSIDVKINMSSFLPVFNFSLYHTKTH
ncbi:MAG: pilus assembly PilX N-terminal domain-containing protein [Candidatus Gracilibacteria bacterium]